MRCSFWSAEIYFYKRRLSLEHKKCPLHSWIRIFDGFNINAFNVNVTIIIWLMYRRPIIRTYAFDELPIMIKEIYFYSVTLVLTIPIRRIALVYGLNIHSYFIIYFFIFFKTILLKFEIRLLRIECLCDHVMLGILIFININSLLQV